MIDAEQAALRAQVIIEYPADDPDNGWELYEFSQGWLVNWHGWKGPPDHFWMVIERRNGLIRHFTTYMPPQKILSEYEEQEGEVRNNNCAPMPTQNQNQRINQVQSQDQDQESSWFPSGKAESVPPEDRGRTLSAARLRLCDSS